MAERLLARKLARELRADEVQVVVGADGEDGNCFKCEWVYTMGGRQDEKIFGPDS